MRGWRRWGPFVVGALGLAVVLAIRTWSQLPTDALIEDIAFVVAGVAAWLRRPETPVGWLMTAYGPLDACFHLSNTRVPLLWTLSSPLFLIAQSILAYVLLTYPRGRPVSRAERIVVGLIALNFVNQLLIQCFVDPRELGCADCPPGLNLMLVHAATKSAVRYAVDVNPWLLTLIMVPTFVLLLRRFVRASGPGRRVIGPVVLPALAFVFANRVGGLAQAFVFYAHPFQPSQPPAIVDTLSHVEEVAVIVLPITLLLGLLLGRLRHARVSRLVVELGELPAGDRLEPALARALGDPSLRIALWDEERGEHVRDGMPFAVPQDGEQVCTRLEAAGRPLGLMVHDRALLDEPGLVDATAAAARMAVDNERLQAEVQRQLEEVRDSRTRLVKAQDDERRRLERDLHDGAQYRLIRVAMALDVARSAAEDAAADDPVLSASLRAAEEELASAVQELRDLAGGIHPAVLVQFGLAAGLLSLAEGAAIPVRLDAVPDRKLPPDVETTAYFVVSEALANVAKHANATRAVVIATIVGDRLEITVSDDGTGGADPNRGSGLRGLVDRVSAMGGTLEVSGEEERGTAVRAALPVQPVPSPPAAAQT